MGKQHLWENDRFFSGLHLPSLGALLPHSHVSQMWGHWGPFFNTSVFIHLGWGEKMGNTFFLRSLSSGMPHQIFFLHLEEGSRYIDVFVEDYSVVIIAKPGNDRVSAHCWRYVSILGYAILFVLHPAGPLEHSILCNYCINFKR